MRGPAPVFAGRQRGLQGPEPLPSPPLPRSPASLTGDPVTATAGTVTAASVAVTSIGAGQGERGASGGGWAAECLLNLHLTDGRAAGRGGGAGPHAGCARRSGSVLAEAEASRA